MASPISATTTLSPTANCRSSPTQATAQHDDLSTGALSWYSTPLVPGHSLSTPIVDPTELQSACYTNPGQRRRSPGPEKPTAPALFPPPLVLDKQKTARLRHAIDLGELRSQGSDDPLQAGGHLSAGEHDRAPHPAPASSRRHQYLRSPQLLHRVQEGLPPRARRPAALQRRTRRRSRPALRPHAQELALPHVPHTLQDVQQPNPRLPKQPPPQRRTAAGARARPSTAP
mmetsp:Transcript_86512/g.231893  ORF Transcript_86512/g.231893 Transcript_86512/m.231893 type:complete len:229 (+) Transcript_86512:171-857(+)